MRLGDYILCASMTLNVLAMGAYAWQGHWKQAGYWLAVMQLNFWLAWAVCMAGLLGFILVRG